MTYGEVAIGSPTTVIEGRYGAGLNVAPDGRLLMLRRPERGERDMVVVTGWHLEVEAHRARHQVLILDTNAVSALFLGDPSLAEVLAGTSRHHLPAVVSRDDDFDRVSGLLRLDS